MSAAVSPAPPLKPPSLAAIGCFDGTADAGRWLEKVEGAFKLVNDGLNADASTLIRAINMSLERDAATFVESSENLRHIVQQAHQGLATPPDLVTFQRYLKDRYRPIVVDVKPDFFMSVELQQDYDEPLTAYHSRVVNTLQRAGGRDKPLSNAEPLSSLETNTLRDYIKLSTASSESAIEIVQRSSAIQCVKTDIARRDARDAKITLMEAYIQRQSGFPASEELSRAYKLPAGLIDVWGGSQASLITVDTLMTQLQPSMSHLGIRPTWTGAVSDQRPGPIAPPQTHNCSDHHAPTAPPQNTFYTVPALRDASYRPNVVAPVARSNQLELKPASESRNQHINGSAPLPRGGASSGDALLQRWEVTWLKSMMLQTQKYDKTWVPDRVHARSALIYLNSDEVEYEAVPSESSHCCPPVTARFATIEPSPEFVWNDDSPPVWLSTLRADLSATVEDADDEDESEQPETIKGDLLLADPPTLESVAQGALWVMTLLSEAMPPPKKRKGMPISEMLDDQLPEAVPLVREKLVRKNAKTLSDIWGREGLGPIDWKALANRIYVPISLMDLWQISPELFKQFRKLSSRVTVPRRRPKKNLSFSLGAQSVQTSPPDLASKSSSTHNTDLLRKHRGGRSSSGFLSFSLRDTRANRYLTSILGKRLLIKALR
ncbi:hypothetical protein E4U19_003209 [Claviceps sp. Clav32 group G5]|nr:hypothetical protein E4U19_003209 [Claviceps sp. Clav32 group G5]